MPPTWSSSVSTARELSWRRAACSALSLANASSMILKARAVRGSLLSRSLLPAIMTSWNSPPALHQERMDWNKSPTCTLKHLLPCRRELLSLGLQYS